MILAIKKLYIEGLVRCSLASRFVHPTTIHQSQLLAGFILHAVVDVLALH